MTVYRFKTEETVEHEHEQRIELPVDMGTATQRLEDRMAKQVAETRAIDGLSKDEKVVAVFRDKQQIWPRQYKKKNKPPVSTPDDVDPDYEAAVQDLRPTFGKT